MNTFNEKVTLFAPLLDAKFQAEAKTAFLEVNAADVSFVGTRKVKYPVIDMDGMVDYDRVGGFAKGGVKIEFQEHELAIDRAMGFEIDVMDDDELLFTAFANTMGEFIRTQVVPEIDAYRFATFFGFAKSVQDDTTAVIGTGSPVAPEFPNTQLFDQITLADNIVNTAIGAGQFLAAFDDAIEYVENEEVNPANCIAFISNEFAKGLKQDDKVERRLDVSEINVGTIKRKVKMLEETALVQIPPKRFKTIIELLNDLQGGETGFKAGGAAVDMRLMLVDRAAVTCITKHAKLRYFAPDVNQDADAHKMQYRVFHDVISRDRKRKAIYIHTA